MHDALRLRAAGAKAEAAGLSLWFAFSMQPWRELMCRLSNALLVSQLAESLMLLLILGLLSLGIQTTMGIAEGFNPKNLYLMSLDPVRDDIRPSTQ